MHAYKNVCHLPVAKEQSFTKAAEQLHITQPTLSRQMAAFEEKLGITLFIRNGKKIFLTDEGILLKWMYKMTVNLIHLFFLREIRKERGLYEWCEPVSKFDPCKMRC